MGHEFFSEEDGRFLVHKNLLRMVQASVNSKLFKSLYFEQDNSEADVLEDGNLSCAVYVSFLLHNLGLVEQPHTFVSHLLKDLKKSGWIKINEPLPGSIIVWGPWEHSSHAHIGFYIGEEVVISNVDTYKSPQEHHWTYGEDEEGNPNREVTNIYWHPDFGDPEDFEEQN